MSLSDIKTRMSAAVKAAAKPAATVTLVAVSKMQPLEKVEAVLAQGQRVFGENRVQDAVERWLPLKEKYPDVQLHLIGHLQSNKAKDAVKLFDVIETIDSEKLAAAVKAEMDKQKKALSLFIQVNTGEEAQKDGVAPKDLGKLVDYFRAALKIEPAGLMCIPPADELPDMHFALLHKLAQEFGLKKLSMGMSADFETAIRYGATHIRVGSALFGVRENH